MSTGVYHKSAAKLIRPFFGAATLETALDGAQIRLFDDQPFTDATSFTVEEQDVRILSITIRPNIHDRTLSGGTIPRGKLVLAISAFNPFMKKTVLVSKTSLSGQPPEDVQIGAEVLESLGGGSSITVDVAICLAQQLPKNPGSPFLQGHWVSKRTFDLRPPKLSEDFDIVPMEDEDWKAMGMPAKTLYFVDYYGGVNEPVTKDHPLAKVSVHSDVFKKLSVDTRACSHYKTRFV